MAIQNKENHFLGVNWKVRAKNPQFWLAIALSIIVPPLVYTGTEFSTVTSWGKFFDVLGNGFANPYIVLMMLVSIYNSISDKTTKGFGDTFIAKQYLRPRTDKDPRYAVDWEVNVDKKAQQEPKEEIEMTERENVNELKPEKEMTDEMYDQYYTTQTKDNGLNDGKPLRNKIEYDESQPFTDDSEDVEFTTVDIADNTPQPKQHSVVDNWEDDNEVKGMLKDEEPSKLTAPPEQDEEVEESKEAK